MASTCYGTGGVGVNYQVPVLYVLNWYDVLLSHRFYRTHFRVECRLFGSQGLGPLCYAIAGPGAEMASRNNAPEAGCFVEGAVRPRPHAPSG